MTRLTPLPIEENPRLAALLAPIQQISGYVPNSFRTIARRPDILEGLLALSVAVMAGEQSRLSTSLKFMIAHVASQAAGCQYCSVHTVANAGDAGEDARRLEEVWSFETSALFTDAERAALRVAQGAGLSPNAVTAADLAALRVHYDDDSVVEIVATIALFGFYNRWNDTMATELEHKPAGFAERNTIARHGWDQGKHGATQQA